MITPFDIENKQFGKSMRGYNVEEVDIFLDEIMLDYEKLLDENKNLTGKVEQLKKELDSSKQSENSVLNTLESAKHLMSDISASAEKRAEIILKNARLDAEVIMRDAKDSIGKLTEEGEDLKKKVTAYRNRYRQLLESELEQLDGSSATLFADLEKDFIPASLSSETETKVVESVEPSETKVVVETVEENFEEELKTYENTPEAKSALEMIMEDLKKAPPVDDKSKTRVIK